MSGLYDERGDIAIEAVRPVASEYGLTPSRMRPCIAYYLDGNDLGGLPRHNVAFTLAMELRELTDANESAMQSAIKRWASKTAYPQQRALRAVTDALRKNPDGRWRWFAPGLRKGPGGRYAEVLKEICEAVGCPANCPRYIHLHIGHRSETYERFLEIGWDRILRRRRKWAPEVYQAICTRERQLGFSPGSRLLVTYGQLSEIAGVDRTTVGRCLRFLSEYGLITFVAGSGSGPHASDRKPSEIRRVTPIPEVPQKPGIPSIGAITTGGTSPPKNIGGTTPP